MQRQLTYAPHGHVLTNAGVWTADGQWIVYDVRSDPAGAVFDGTRIERVHVETGKIQVLYESRRGACCGVASCSPVDDRVVFILGPADPTPDWQYAPWHRRGVIVDGTRLGAAIDVDACDLTPPFTPGALRGGSHVHMFSPDGAWLSFTYEDHVLASRAADPSLQDAVADFNQRNVAVALPTPVRVPRTHPRNHDGAFFSVVATRTVNQPRAGSDEICRAYEEAWIGGGSARSLAFLGDVVGADGRPLTELFVLEVPDDLTRPGDGPLAGTPTRRPAPPAGTRQRRITFTAERKFPGIQGTRFWPRSSPDGARIAFLMRGETGVVQLWTVAPRGGEPRQLTRNAFDVASAFTWSCDGGRLTYVADGSVMIVDAETGRSRRITPAADRAGDPRPEACVFSPDGSRIALVRAVAAGDRRFNQIFVAEVNAR